MSTDKMGGNDGGNGDSNEDSLIKLVANVFSEHQSIDFTNIEYMHRYAEYRSEEPDSHFSDTVDKTL
jgi:hypothetical protein